MSADISFDLESQGFVSRSSLKAWVHKRGGLGRAEPCLLVTDVARTKTRDAGEDLAYRRTIEGGANAEGGGSPKLYLDHVAFLAKRPGNPFPQMISIGRARNSDIVLALGTVSKVQCYFMMTGDEWAIVDQRSRNGTYLNAQPLTPGTKTPLKDGDTIRLGAEVTVKFLLPDSLLAQLKG